MKLALLVIAWVFVLAQSAHAAKITVAAASDLKGALGEIARGFEAANPGHTVEVVYGSSGKLQTQIRQGAPYDLFFSADISYARDLARLGFAGSAVVPYAIGRIVVWSATIDAADLALEDLTAPAFARIAIANPKHAPYGMRATEALQAAGLWPQLEKKLIYGESVAAAAQYAQTGNAHAGIIALSLALSPALAKGQFALIPSRLHRPLEQGFVITKRASDSSLARQFARYAQSVPAQEILRRYGFEQPGKAAVFSDAIH